jgi:O-antigen biosynthesis protein
VCIIPFKDIPLTNATNPVKVFEYLSAGKPVISTKLNEISKYEAYVKLAVTKEEWEIAIQESLTEVKTHDLLIQRFDFAKQNTWEERAQRITNEISKLFPKISIIVLSYNNLPYTRLCLESIIENTSYPNYEIIVVDNASEKSTVKYLKSVKASLGNFILILNDENLGFSKANNQGFAISAGEYIVFLNNDTIVTPGWVHGLLYHLQKNPSAGMVGPVTNSIGNEAKIDVLV